MVVMCCLLLVSVDFGRVAAGSFQREASQEENENNSQQLWQENDCEGEFGY